MGKGALGAHRQRHLAETYGKVLQLNLEPIIGFIESFYVHWALEEVVCESC